MLSSHPKPLSYRGKYWQLALENFSKMEKPWISREEAASLLNLSIRRVLEYCAAGKIKTYRPGGNIGPKQLLYADVQKLLNERENKESRAKVRALSACEPKKVRDIAKMIDAEAAGEPRTVFISHAADFEWLTLEEAASVVKLSRRVLRALIILGRLPALRDDVRPTGEKARPGDSWRVKMGDLKQIGGELQARPADDSEHLTA